MRVNGLSWPESMARSLQQYVHSYKGEEREVARQLGAFIDAVLGDMHARWDMSDDLRGRLGDIQNKFFKWSGLNWVTEQGRAGFVMWLSEHLGEVAGKSLDQMDRARQALLRFHGITAEKWDALRQMTQTLDDGRTLLVPTKARDLPDAALEHLLPDNLRHGKSPARERRRSRELSRLRDRLQTEALAMISDETGFAIVEPDDKALVNWETPRLCRGTSRV